MRIHRVLPASYGNGPGLRFSLWVQGCFRGCPGCFNPGSHDPDGGYEAGVGEIIEMIPFGEVCGITVSGGEPFRQAGELAVLLEEAGRRGLHRLVYTGFTYEELSGHEDPVVEKCLPLIDLLIDGPYVKDKPPETAWTGSGNQRVLELRKGKITGQYRKSGAEAGRIDGEVIIDGSGGVIVTGIFDSALLTGEESPGR